MSSYKHLYLESKREYEELKMQQGGGGTGFYVFMFPEYLQKDVQAIMDNKYAKIESIRDIQGVYEYKLFEEGVFNNRSDGDKSKIKRSSENKGLGRNISSGIKKMFKSKDKNFVDTEIYLPSVNIDESLKKSYITFHDDSKDEKIKYITDLSKHLSDTLNASSKLTGNDAIEMNRVLIVNIGRIYNTYYKGNENLREKKGKVIKETDRSWDPKIVSLNFNKSPLLLENPSDNSDTSDVLPLPSKLSNVPSDEVPSATSSESKSV